MKSSKSTQTVARRQTAVPGGLGEHDPLASSAERIVEAIRAVEGRMVKAFGVASDDCVRTEGINGPLTTESLDRYVRYRVAAIASAALRDAEATVVEELVRISQLVPHGVEGCSYRHAQLGYNETGGYDRACTENSPDVPRIVQRPTAPEEPLTHLEAPAIRGLDVAKVAQSAQRRRHMLDFEEIDETAAAPVGDASVHARGVHSASAETHQSRMMSLASLAQTLQQPPGISHEKFQRNQFVTSSAIPQSHRHQQQLGGELRTTRAQTYAHVLQQALRSD